MIISRKKCKASSNRVHVNIKFLKVVIILIWIQNPFDFMKIVLKNMMIASGANIYCQINRMMNYIFSIKLRWSLFCFLTLTVKTSKKLINYNKNKTCLFFMTDKCEIISFVPRKSPLIHIVLLSK